MEVHFEDTGNLYFDEIHFNQNKGGSLCSIRKFTLHLVEVQCKQARKLLFVEIRFSQNGSSLFTAWKFT